MSPEDLAVKPRRAEADRSGSCPPGRRVSATCRSTGCRRRWPLARSLRLAPC